MYLRSCYNEPERKLGDKRENITAFLLPLCFLPTQSKVSDRGWTFQILFQSAILTTSWSALQGFSNISQITCLWDSFFASKKARFVRLPETCVSRILHCWNEICMTTSGKTTPSDRFAFANRWFPFYARRHFSSLCSLKQTLNCQQRRRRMYSNKILGRILRLFLISGKK